MLNLSFLSSFGDYTLDFLTSLQIVTVLRASRVPSSRIGRLFHYGCQHPHLGFSCNLTGSTFD